MPGKSLRIAENRRTALSASSAFPRQRCAKAVSVNSFTAQNERDRLGEAVDVPNRGGDTDDDDRLGEGGGGLAWRMMGTDNVKHNEAK